MIERRASTANHCNADQAKRARPTQLGSAPFISRDGHRAPGLNGAKNAQAPAFETWSACDLFDRAQEMQVEGHTFMTKTELIKALQAS